MPGKRAHDTAFEERLPSAGKPPGTSSKKKKHSRASSPSSPPTLPAVATLDRTHPHTVHPARIIPYDASTPLTIPSAQPATSLPPLPSIHDALLSRIPFTHSSIAATKYLPTTSTGTATGGVPTAQNYEQLEFLGDAYLELLSTRIIFSRFPALLTGKQARLREGMVRNSTLASFARRYGFDQRVAAANRDALAAKGWEKVLADVFEAYVAAIILADPEHGVQRTERWLEALWAPFLLSQFPAAGDGQQAGAQAAGAEGVLHALDRPWKDELARLVGGKEVRLAYEEEAPMRVTADGGMQQHSVAVFLTGYGFTGRRLGGGVGCGRKEAGMLAARDAIEGAGKALVEELSERKRVKDEERRKRLKDERGEDWVPGKKT